MNTVKTIEREQEFREKVRERFGAMVENKKKGKNIEISIYNYTIRESNYRKIVKKWNNPYFVCLYIDRFRSVLFNLMDTNNPEFLERVKKGEISSKKVGFLTHQEMNEKQWNELIKKKMIRDEHKYNDDMRIATSEFKCRKCKQEKCSYYQLQTRSADEPMTTFVTCMNCGNQWKC